MMPKRIMMSRQRPWRAEHPDAVRIDRATKWGNPYRVVRGECPLDGKCWRVERDGEVRELHLPTKEMAVKAAVRQYILDIYNDPVRVAWAGLVAAELGGKDLACWCPLPPEGKPDICHGAVLLSIANGEG